MRWSPTETKAYKQRIKQAAPKVPIAQNVLHAFLVGGAICTVGQVLLNLLDQQGMPFSSSAMVTASLLIGVGAILTGLGVYDDIGKVGGMGAALPITGFGNAIVAPAMEHKREGYLFGVGSKLFSIAGPVIIYGLLTALISSAIHFWFLM